MGQSPSSASYNQEGKGLPFYQGNADFGDLYPVTKTWCNQPRKTAEAGDILISVRAPIGAVNIAGEECCIGRGLAAIRQNGSVVSRDYLFHCLQANRSKLEAMGTGSTFKAIGKRSLSSLAIPIYGLEKQKMIVKQLEGVNECLAAAVTALTMFDTLVKSRFVEMFGDPKLEPNKWSTKTLGEVCATRLGKMLDAKKQTGKCSYPYLANTNVQWFHFDLTDLRQMDFSDEDRIEFGLKNGDVMVTEGGEIGRCAIWREEIPNCYFQKAVHRVRCDSEVLLPEYFVWCFKMKADLGLFESYVSQSTIAHLTGKKIKQVPIPLPPLSLQREFASFVAEVDKSRFNLLKAYGSIIALFRVLFP